MHLSEKTVESRLGYDGRIIKVYSDTAELENGKTAPRDVVKHPGGVCVVPLTEDNRVIVVRQFRYPFQKVLLEIPAGKLEYGENPLECGKRELMEEAGCTAEAYTDLGCLYPTPAYDTEIIYMYLARGLKPTKQKLDEDEFLEVESIPLEQLVDMVMSGEICDAKTQLALLKTARLLKGD